jgi:flagellin
MGMQINTNVTAMNALQNLDNVSNSVNTSIERLSSGLRINTAADDPSGYIISQSLKAQIGGLNQAISNSQEATNLIQTAEGGLSQVTSLLDSIRQLAVHASNTGVNDQTAVQADQTQIQSALASIQQIATQTQFGDKSLLNGTSGVTASVVSITNVGGIYIGGTIGNGVITQTGNVTVTVNNAATRAVSMAAGVTYASVNASISTVNGTTTGAGGTVVINGQTVTVTGAQTVQSMLNAINNLSGSTGVSAAFSAANGSGYIVLTQTNYGANYGITESESASILGGVAGLSSTGANATVTVVAMGLVAGSATTVVSTFVGGRGAADSGLYVTDTNGNSILMTEAGNKTTTAMAVANVTAGNLQFQVGANAGQTVNTSLGNIQTQNLGGSVVSGQNLSTINVTTSQGATNAIQIVDNSISQVSQLSANLGAFQNNVLNSAIQYMGVGVQNLSASESQIADTDVAAEVTSLTKNQIIEQAAVSVLAQANAAPQMVLKLLS